MSSSNPLPAAPANNASSAAKPKDEWTFKHGFLLAFVLFAILNSLPFADAARFRKAVEACEKNLLRDQHCDVQGVAITPAVPTASSGK